MAKLIICNVSGFSFFKQEVNENSLKRLNGYLENLQKPGFRSFKPTQLTFYVREREPNSSNVQESFSASGAFILCRMYLSVFKFFQTSTWPCAVIMTFQLNKILSIHENMY